MSNAFYEQYREDNDDVSVSPRGSLAFPVHFHINVEVFLMKKGKYDVTVNEKTCRVTDGSVAFFSSYDLHGYSAEYENDDGIKQPCFCDNGLVVLIPPRYLVGFLSKTSDLSAKNPVVTDAKLCDELTEIANRILAKENATEEFRQAGVDLFLSLIREAFEFIPATRKTDHSLIREILNYIMLHYRENINVNSIAAALGYTREHLSRTFHEYFNESIPRYVNALRLDYVNNKIKSDDSARTSDVVFEAGFGSLQTFYRVKNQFSAPLAATRKSAE